MRTTLPLGFALLMNLGVHEIAVGQACCSAGPPLLGSLEFPSTSSGVVQVALSYEYNHLQDILSGTTRLSDNSRRRTTQSLLLELGYGISSTISLSGLFSFVQQERRTASVLSTSPELSLTTRGIGDAILLLKYRLFPLTIRTQREVVIGVGGKIPLGASTITFQSILLPADMQPGTGAWDGVLWAYASQGFLPLAPVTAFATASYRITGTNSRYGTRQEGYKFGNEFVGSIGAGYRTDGLFDYSLHLRYRSVTPDRFGGFEIPNTGGLWFSILPGINFKLSDSFTLRATGQLPLYRKLLGTQLTTTYTASISVFYRSQQE